ncbi:MAG: MBL fold metallo-hydrolase [Bacteroidota bacterium]
MRVKLWGTRGSVPSPGPETQIYGGNTACVTVTAGDDLIVLDAGSGIRRLGNDEMVKKHPVIHILLTHLHMDHILGLGFFGPLYNPAQEVHIWGPSSFNHSLVDRLNRYLSPPLFPVNIRELPAKVIFHEVTHGFFEINGLTVYANYVCHPGPTLGYRIQSDKHTFAYIPDHEPALGLRNFSVDPEWTSGYNLAEDADLLIHDAQFSDEEYKHCIGWGHSSMAHALKFAKLAKVKRLLFFHHDPNHSDKLLEELAHKYIKQFPFNAALGREGEAVDLAVI